MWTYEEQEERIPGNRLLSVSIELPDCDLQLSSAPQLLSAHVDSARPLSDNARPLWRPICPDLDG
eukprot:scaffold162516_cov27-Tisochrysis_lutea.AAC.1